ncbi:MAG: hypothetical protein IKC22_01100 [Bacilli bacterium]|nr:hypothetical protein [bacterium]MBR2890981.1 hypothetical protein [Bacilli bacterium]MBR3890286.1 hypothetical protein [bacterium]
MDFDLNYLAQYKSVIEEIVRAELKKQKIPTFISAIVHSVNQDGTVNVYLPPNKDNIVTKLLNKSGEILESNDSVEIMAKGGNLSNAWVMVKHGN